MRFGLLLVITVRAYVSVMCRERPHGLGLMDLEKRGRFGVAERRARRRNRESTGQRAYRLGSCAGVGAPAVTVVAGLTRLMWPEFVGRPRGRTMIVWVAWPL